MRDGTYSVDCISCGHGAGGSEKLVDVAWYANMIVCGRLNSHVFGDETKFWCVVYRIAQFFQGK